MKRHASAVWTGGLRGGRGRMSTQTKVLSDTAYSFATRFEAEPGTNPEELVAAALAGCFSMALSAELEGAGFKPESVQTTATLNFEFGDKGWSTTGIHLDTTAKVPDIDDSRFQQIANGAKSGCPISRTLNPSINITLAAKLQS